MYAVYVCICVCVRRGRMAIKRLHQHAIVIQTLNGSDMNLKIARGEGLSPITWKNRKNSIMAVHTRVKGFGGGAFLSFNGDSRLENPGLSLPETLNDKGIKRKIAYIQKFMHTHIHTQRRLPSMNPVPNTTFLRPCYSTEKPPSNSISRCRIYFNAFFFGSSTKLQYSDKRLEINSSSRMVRLFSDSLRGAFNGVVWCGKW